MTDHNQAPTIAEEQQGFSVMEGLRNSRFGMFVTAGVASLTLASSAEAVVLALDPTVVSADGNVPARLATESDNATGGCKSTDTPSASPQYHINSGFQALNGGNSIKSTKPGSIVKFVSRIAGGNVDSFNEEVDTVAPMYHFPKDMEILKRGSQPAWSKAGGMPHWVVKDLCHWKDKRHISFLVKVDSAAQKGKDLCMPYDIWARTGNTYRPDPPLNQYSCLKVK